MIRRLATPKFIEMLQKKASLSHKNLEDYSNKVEKKKSYFAKSEEFSPFTKAKVTSEKEFFQQYLNHQKLI
jgi:hypothetical protein